MADELPTDVLALQAEVTKLRPLSGQLATTQAELNKHIEGAKTLTSMRDALQAKVAGFEKQLGELTPQVTELKSLKETHAKVLSQFVGHLQGQLKLHNLGDDVLKDRSLDQLLAMADALKSIKPAGGTDTKGLGLGGGGSTNNGAANTFDADYAIIKAAKERIGIKA